jgi:DNA helicase HerA-like ATPase
MSKYRFDFGYLADLSHNPAIIDNLKDRFEHTYIVGKTGMGKSSLMEHMAMYDSTQGYAVIFIDPKGDSTRRLYSLIEDKSKVIYISVKNPTVINPLDKPTHSIDDIISEFIQILDVLITLTSSNPESTVLMRELVSRAIRAITRDEDKNIEYLVKFLMYEDVRKEARAYIKDESIKKYWEVFDDPRELKGNFKIKQKHETSQRVASRLIEVSEGKMKDFVVGRNELDISRIVSEGKIALVDTSKMSMNARIYLTNLIVYSVLSYCEFLDVETVKPQPLLIYVDEFQTTISPWLTDLLARSRSRKVGFTLAHQSFSQIDRRILGVILDVVGTMVCFRCGDEVANRLSGYFDVKAKELFNLQKYHAWVRIGIENSLVECFPPLEVKSLSDPLSIIPSREIQEVFDFLNDGWIERE